MECSEKERRSGLKRRGEIMWSEEERWSEVEWSGVEWSGVKMRIFSALICSKQFFCNKGECDTFSKSLASFEDR